MNEQPLQPIRSRWPAWKRWLIGIGLLAALLVPLLLWGPKVAAGFANPEAVAARIREAGAAGALFMIGLQTLQVIIAPIPGQVVNFVAGYVFGFLPGTLLSWVGTVAGAALAMSLARFLGRPLVERLVSPSSLERVDAFMAGQGLRFFFLVFLIPFLPDDAICFVAGLTALPLSLLILASAVGRLPGLAVSVWAGAHAGAVPTPLLVVAAGAGLLLLIVAWRFGDRIEASLMERVAKLKG